MSAPQSTPVPSTAGSPGAKVSRFQAELLRRENFVAVVGADVVNSWQANWVILENPEICFTHPQKVNSMRHVYNNFLHFSQKNSSEAISKLNADFHMLKGMISVVHLDRLSAAAVCAFDRHFPGSKIECLPKSSGVQLGMRVRLILDSGDCRTYYVKTHADGRLFSNSAPAKVVQPGELLVYKVLEMTGYGCESFFFQRNFSDVYIATLDAGHGGRFHSFKRATGGVDCEADMSYGRNLWGCLDMINPRPKENNWDIVEAALQSDVTAQRFLFNLASLDMLSRIFRLHDLLNNYDNFGFVASAPGQFVLKIIDFHIADDLNLAMSDQHFDGFVAGNSLFNYYASHRIVRFALHDRSARERAKDALRALQADSLSKLHDCIDTAFACVLEYLRSLEVSGEEKIHADVMMDGLQSLSDVFHQNVRYFTDRLQSWLE
jgi:hypothetical protein